MIKNSIFKEVYWFVFLLLFIGLDSCSPNTFVKTIPYKKHVISGSFGGPIVDVPGIAPIPLPLTTIGYGYGFKPKTSLYANWHTTSFAYGTGHIQLGTTHKLVNFDSKKMGVTGCPSIHVMIDRWESNFKYYPQIDFNWYWDFSKQNKERFFKVNSMYAGFGSILETGRREFFLNEQQKRFFSSVHYGHIFERKHFDFSVELKYLAPLRSNENIVFDYVSLGNTGTFGLYFGVKFKIGNHEN
jgi:hypothetical protein